MTDQLPYATEVPWATSGFGIDVSDCTTSEQAIVAAGLDWETALGPLYGPKPSKGGGGKILADRKAIYRTDTFDVLGIGTLQYQPWQNRECFDWLDSLVADGVMQYDVAGQRKGGAMVWMVAKLTEGLTINGEDYHQNIIITTRHDGGGSVRAVPTNVRGICSNIVRSAFQKGALVRVVHRPNMAQKMLAAKQLMVVNAKTGDRMKQWLELAQAHTLTGAEYEGIETELLGSLDDATPKQRRDKIEAFRAIYAIEAELHGPTAYTLWNAVTGYSDHGARRSYQSEGTVRNERRFFDVIEGNGAIFKAQAVKAINQLDGALAKATI